MDYEDDPVCQRLVAAVEEARGRMYNEENIPQFDSIKKGMRLLQRQKNAENTQDLLKSDIELIYEIPKEQINKKRFMYQPKEKETSYFEPVDEEQRESVSSSTEND